jgi:hypothetical protein
MLIPFGVLSAAARGITPFSSDYELIASAFGTGSSGVITFSSIPATYKHLQIRYTAKNSSTATDINLTFNGITSGSYIRHRLFGNGSVMDSNSSSTSATSIQLTEAMASSTTTALTSAGVIDILDYVSSTKNTTIQARYGQSTNLNRIYSVTGALFNTASITSITLTASANNYANISRFSLYGIKG